MVDLLEIKDIPETVFDLSVVKKEEDIPHLLSKLITDREEEKSLQTIVGMINFSYKSKQYTLYETCELLYRLSNYVDFEHEWRSFLYGITGNLELALDGYGDVDSSRKEIEMFLAKHEEYSALFDLVLRDYSLRNTKDDFLVAYEEESETSF